MTDLIDTYDEYEFSDDAIGHMASTFGNREQMLVAANAAEGESVAQTGVEMFREWKGIFQYHAITGREERRALILQGLEQFFEDSKEEVLAEMAANIEDL